MDIELVEKYLRDECTLEEASHVLKWLTTPEGQAYLKMCLEQDLDNEHDVSTEVDSEMVYAKIKSHIEQSPDRVF
ncbi:MAG: hypothetical protein ACK4GN_14025, partial [Runella sp.]